MTIFVFTEILVYLFGLKAFSTFWKKMELPHLFPVEVKR